LQASRSHFGKFVATVAPGERPELLAVILGRGRPAERVRMVR
jgi:hypothetical protein